MNLLSRFTSFFLLTLLSPVQLVAEIVVKNGDRIDFMGDSITAQGDSASGYLGLVIHELKTEGIEVTAIPVGIPGHNSGAPCLKAPRPEKGSWPTAPIPTKTAKL